MSSISYMVKSMNSLICGVDLFCGAGGLTNGLGSAGIDVRLGVDSDPDCEFPYTVNNKAAFLLQPVESTEASEISDIFEGEISTLLAGCAPCQPFSNYSLGRSSQSDKRWHLLEHFSRLVQQVRPQLVTMENVPLLEREEIFSSFMETLANEKFNVSYDVVNCADYGTPQKRRRLVLLASRLAPIRLIPPTTPKGYHLTVRSAIGDLPPLEAGEYSDHDPLHQACKRSSLNLKRIQASTPGGSWHDWNEELIAKCHHRKTGRTFKSIYGRMEWEKPSPTLTTQFYDFGNGRYGHPEQDRAISLREGAILQSFPSTYQFFPENATIRKRKIGMLIGNAVPVSLGAAIGKSVISHVNQWLLQNKKIDMALSIFSSDENI